jgi:hypothetical protein
VDKYPRARFQKQALLKTWTTEWDRILGEDERLTLVPVGNHSRGATFLNANQEIDPAICEVFDKISHSLEGIMFARYDLKCASLESLRQGKDFTILEVNGAGAEPAHIYDPQNALWRAYRDLFRHWNTLYMLSRAQHKRGVPYMSWAEAREAWRRHRRAYR